MNEEKFTALLHTYIADVVNEIISETKQNEDDALTNFVGSKVYSLLSDEKTKMWHFSSKALCKMYLDEKDNRLEIPEAC